MTQKEQLGRKHVAAWRASGLTQRRYCEEHDYSRSALGYWSWKINHEKKSGGFVEVPTNGSAERVESSTAPLELCIGDRYRVRITEGCSLQAVKELLDIIEAR